MTEDIHGMKVDVQSNVAVAVVDCAHCRGTGTCKCSYCCKINFGSSYQNHAYKGPCSVCGGVGAKIISKKIE
jgi:hypothetical protein